MAIAKTPITAAGRVLPSDALALIDAFYPAGFVQELVSQSLRLDAGNCSKLAAILKAVEAIDPQLFVLHGIHHVEFVVSLEEIRLAVEHQRAASLQNPQATVKYLTALPMFDGRHPISLLYSCLEMCPDHFPVSGSSDLAFIAPEETRTGLLGDLGAVHEAIAASNWKAATVLGGALVEALLLWKVEQLPWKTAQKAKGKGDIMRWDLDTFVLVARELNVINDATVTQANLARDARNLIHPGKMIRERAECHRGTAFAAAAAIDYVIRDLENPYHIKPGQQ